MNDRNVVTTHNFKENKRAISTRDLIPTKRQVSSEDIEVLLKKINITELVDKGCKDCRGSGWAKINNTLELCKCLDRNNEEDNKNESENRSK